MEVVGLLASAAQISVYACNIVSTISDIRVAIHKTPSLLREQSQQLEVLSVAVENIKLDFTLHNDLLAGYLLAVQDKIQIIYNIVRLRSQGPTNSLVGKFHTALTTVARNKEVESSFATLHTHCQTLFFYMASTRPHQYNVGRPMPAPSTSGEIVASNRNLQVGLCLCYT